ncbi:MAG: adenylate/guanylate cyclase domain-containing protein [Planctomycetes bacterium]|nr:adenylate/guanylate cyclase domain-containing protein [Planctomycetota bacterium]
MDRQKMTVCFSDITNFSRIMESYDEEKSVGLLQDIFTDIGDIIVKNDGKIRKYIGDAMLFTFSDSKKAVKAVKEIAQLRKTLDEFEVETHVTAATGEVLVTEIGHKTRIIEDIFGSTVNTAAKLLKTASANESNYALCPDTQKFDISEP